jgi:hypothetical protein
MGRFVIPSERSERRDHTGRPFFYCLKPIDEVLTHKNQIPYLADAKKVERWKELFFSESWSVTDGFVRRLTAATDQLSLNLSVTQAWKTFINYDVAPRDDFHASNPFKTFRDIPVRARYQFLLDDAETQIMSFIKGPVCRGSTAVNSIDEQFYTFFIKPDSDLMVRDKGFARQASNKLILPAEDGSDRIEWAVVRRFASYKRLFNL